MATGYLVIRENERVRLLSRNGTDWTKRYPWIAEAALKNRQKRFVIDGEAVILGVDGISDFNALHSRLYDHEVQLYAFDILVMGGDDLRSLPLHLRKANLQQLLARRPDGISVAPFERGEIGPDLFRAVAMGQTTRILKRAYVLPDLLKMLQELEDLREKVRLAESARVLH
ncbi:ATP dependent DNA ligase domain-containing protein [Bradyrhizobium sp. Rc2d]|uniref:ATP-dependent DNA ligase n=1 Tax=Bradyrhizobium sp. Rc2d TaxID=1855321 RepID=UPI00087E5A35|nr:ATP dependent DNA ligase domain-containing protein [Bradyrhizobium sp. Rc2d]